MEAWMQYLYLIATLLFVFGIKRLTNLRKCKSGSRLAAFGMFLAIVAVLLLFRLRRLPDGDGSLAYRGIVHLATRLGRGPHPAQTEYEYVDALSETMPSVRDDLYVVAGARVESAYGRGGLDERSRKRLQRAYARVRTALVRLLLPRR